MLLLLLCTDLPASAVAATLGDFQTEENLELTQKSCLSVFIFREVAGAVSPEDTDLWGAETQI